MNIERLTRKEFDVALRYGRGRAMMYVKRFGLGDVADLVLDACLHNQTYDPQCEDSREEWLLEMFADSSEYPHFVSEIVTSLDGGPENDWDVSQLCFLAALLAERGEDEARRALRDAALFQAKEGNPWIGLHALISVEGVEGIPALARCYGQRLHNDKEDEPPLLVDLSESGELIKKAGESLKTLSAIDRDIAAYWDFCGVNTQVVVNAREDATKKSRREYRRKVRQELPLKKILADASAAVGQHPSQYRRFGLYATPSELKKILQLLNRETNQDTILRLLWVFRKVAAPELDQCFFEMASSNNDDIRSAARVALAQFRHPHIGEFARNILRKEGLGESDWEVLDLFLLNYEPSDANIIIPALHSLRPPYNDVHWFGLSVLRICEEHLAPELAEALYWVYDATPCTTCRRDCIEYLSEFGEVVPHIVEECCYDASERTRQLARKMLGRIQKSDDCVSIAREFS